MSRYLDNLTDEKLLLIAQAIDRLVAHECLTSQCATIRHAVTELLVWAGDALEHEKCEGCL